MNAPDILDSVCPVYDARERHEVIVRSPPATVYASLRTVDFAGSAVIRALLALRGFPGRWRRSGRKRPRWRPLDVDAITAAGFGLVAEQPGRELVLGIAGQFWKAAPHAQPLDFERARAGPTGDTAHALWNFRVSAVPEGTLLTTETRVIVPDAAARRRFRIYWVVIRPFSGLIRRRMLAAVRRAAETRGAGPAASTHERQ